MIATTSSMMTDPPIIENSHPQTLRDALSREIIPNPIEDPPLALGSLI